MDFTLGNLILLGIVTITIIGIGAIILWHINDEYYDSKEERRKKKRNRIVALVIEVVLIGLMVIGCGLYNTHTESGKRALKTWDSEKSGGLNRTVTVYDMQGEEIAKYQGKFDIEESQNEGVVKIKFDMDGKRHIIYAQTGTVLIDEN